MNREILGLGMPEVEPIKRPSVKFLYVVHSVENVASIWKQAQDCDVILLEMVASELDKQIMSMSVQQAGQNNNEFTRRYFLRNLGGISEPFVRNMLVIAAAAKKELHFIDVDIKSTASQKVFNSIQKSNQASVLFLAGRPQEALAKHKEHLKLFAEANREREDLVVNQIEDLEKKHAKAWSGKKIAVIQGAAHNVMYSRYKARNTDQATESLLPSKNFNFDINAETMMILNLAPNAPIPEHKYKEGLLINMLMVPLLAQVHNPTVTLEKAAEIADKIASRHAEWAWNELVESEVKTSRLGDVLKLRNQFRSYYQKLQIVRNTLFVYASRA